MARLLCFLAHTVHVEEPPPHSTILPTASLPTETPLSLPVLPPPPPPPPLRPPTNSLPALPSHYSPLFVAKLGKLFSKFCSQTRSQMVMIYWLKLDKVGYHSAKLEDIR